MSIIVLIPYLLIIFAIPILLGVYVYKDATKRGMNAALWTIVAVFAPSLIGFIIYLLVRGSYSNMECPNCSANVSEQFVVCPECGTKLKPTCNSCNAPIEEHWKVCPKCATPITNLSTDYHSPVYKKDNALGKILLVVILVPIILIALSLFLFSARTTSGSMTMTSYTLTEYEEEKKDASISKWIADCTKTNDNTTAYILKYTNPEQPESCCYAIYVPNIVEASYDVSERGGFFRNHLQLNLNSPKNGESDDTLIYLIEQNANGVSDVQLEVLVDGVEFDCEVKEIDVDPCITWSDFE